MELTFVHLVDGDLALYIDSKLALHSRVMQIEDVLGFLDIDVHVTHEFVEPELEPRGGFPYSLDDLPTWLAGEPPER